MNRNVQNTKGDRIISTNVSKELIQILHQVVDRGTASAANVYGYSVAGKTGTANKVKPNGGYYKKKNITTFASVFPVERPKYVLLVTLDEPNILMGKKSRRTCLLYTSPSPRDRQKSRMPSSA